MSFLRRLFGRGKTEDAVAPVEAVACPHTALAPRWGNAQDMGNEAKATSWVCSSCDDEFTPEQTAELRATEAERLRAEAARIEAARVEAARQD